MKALKKTIAFVLMLGLLITGVVTDDFFVYANEITYTWRETTAERNLYYDEWTKERVGKIYLGETIEEILQMIDDPS